MKKLAVLTSIFVLGFSASVTAETQNSYDSSVERIQSVLKNELVKSRLGGFRVNSIALNANGNFEVYAGLCMVEVQEIPSAPSWPPYRRFQLVNHVCQSND